ncbi:Anucleate primary sterigmata protein A [Daldinia childiae]|uniref:Anucleate primary sterigmata protein A n=1 Tax=Daldinia childiae TaxID=326645 RepID=UPI0014480EBC|nr:Anucleate primary sterigmata protein A [Daldinia childiae]KAF3058181.1 Anucleate primary sterigmata protein A [Daldinia childiae]
MAVWETEDELSSVAASPLPAPIDTPYRTPSRNSKKSRRSATPPGGSASSPPPNGIFDPRRFTPTLHANLVSEILSLRRDQEEKLKIIESLESSLHATQEEQESLQTNLSNTSKESRSLKRQLSLLEGGTSSAIGELAKERDEAVDAITETRRRLEAAQKKVRTQEEDSQRVHDLWAKEKDEWDEERRRYERKIHVAESRLRVVLEEVANLQAAQINGNHDKPESDIEKENDGVSVRTMSMTNSVRYSVMSGPGFGKMNGYSLADELNFDDDDDYQTDPDGRQSVISLARHHRNQSRDSMMSKTHRRNQSSDSQIRPGSIVRSRLFMNQTVLDRLEGGIREDDETSVVSQKVQYTDTGVQFSPPPSPRTVPTKPATPEPVLKSEKPMGLESPSRVEGEIEANQSRKRVYVNKPGPMESPKTRPMVSAASQTSEKAPLLATSQPVIVETKPAPVTILMSAATQTEPAAPKQQPVTPPLSIPSISIVPPTSRPSSPREHVCLRLTRGSINYRHIFIRLRSLQGLRPLLPTATPTTATVDESKNFTPVPGHVPPRNPRRLESSRRSFSAELPTSPPASPSVDDLETRDAYPGNNDDGPLSSAKAPVRRPHRISSLFAGFDVQSSDEQDEFDEDQSDSEYRTALAPRPKTGPSKPNKRVASSAVSASPEQSKPAARQSTSVISKIGSPEVYSSFRLAEAPEGLTRKPSLKVATGAAGRPLSYSTGSRASVMRKSAMIQSGIASHQGLSRTPDLLESKDPPFPIPTRASSRKPPFSISAPSDGQRSPTYTGEHWPRRGRKASVYRSSSIRKARSAAAIPQNQRPGRRGSRSPPPPMSPSEEAPESPGLPPLPTNDITTPRRDRGGSRYRSHRSQPSTNTANTENTNTGSVGSNQQSSTVVDAIAQTMVGEWMFKYVRRRKSFGVADGTGRGEENSNDRHKRWVWLAPYERAILWSSKQPASGNALMGKPGRKLIIQSVLDVKDDNPPPKGSTLIFNRSILILTPQRALKFTATTAERHYLWLTALSFLAHSQQDVPEIIPTANAPNIGPAPDFEAPQAKTKRGGIRDSIRLTKGKNPALMARHDPVPTTNHLEEALSAQQDTFPPVPAHQRDLSRDAAEPPFIPRFHERSHERVHERANQVVLHGRKRSNTGGHIPPPLSFRGFSGPASHSSSYHTSTNSTAGNSVDTAGSSEIYQSQGSTNITWGMSTAGSQRTSEASSRPPGNFFEAIGTVRMEAFISPLAFPRFEDHPDEQEEWRYRARRRSKEARRRRSRSRHRDSYVSRGTRGTDSYYSGSRAGEEDYFRDDPFKGF